MIRNILKKTIASLLAAAVLPAALTLDSRILRADDGATEALIINDTLASGAHRCNVDAPRAGNVFIQLMGSLIRQVKTVS